MKYNLIKLIFLPPSNKLCNSDTRNQTLIIKITIESISRLTSLDRPDFLHCPASWNNR